ALERRVDLLGDLIARQPAVVGVVGHLAPHLGREDVRVARAAAEDLAPGTLSGAAAVDVGGVEEVDARLECRIRTPARLLEADAARIREPRPEGDFRDLEVRRAQLAVAHLRSVGIRRRRDARLWRAAGRSSPRWRRP